MALLNNLKEFTLGEKVNKYSCILEEKLINDSKNYSFEKDVQPIIAGCLTTNNK